MKQVQFLLILFLKLFGLATAMAVLPGGRQGPEADGRHQYYHDGGTPGPRDLMIKRNATASGDQLWLNIDPDIVNPLCGGIFLANINVQYAPDPFYLSSACNKILNFIGGPKGKKDVDLVWTCLGQPTNGSGTRDIKFIISTAADNTLNGATSSTQELEGALEVVSTDDSFIATTSIQVGVKAKASAGKATFQYIYC